MGDTSVLVDILQNADILEPENAEVNCLHADNFCQNCQIKVVLFFFVAVEFIKKFNGDDPEKTFHNKKLKMTVKSELKVSTKKVNFRKKIQNFDFSSMTWPGSFLDP